MSAALSTAFVLLSLPILVLGLLKVLYFPLAMLFEVREGARRARADRIPTVSVIVPAYNEGKVVEACVRSILADTHPTKEVVLVDDGSTDDTLAVLQRFAGLPGVTVVSQRNQGKAAALNTGIAHATGEVLAFVDADGIFRPDTLTELLRPFADPRVGGVCGHDEPVNLNRPQTHLLALLTHVGTGFVRRALALVNCLPVVSGNLGAFRSDVVRSVGGFVEGFVGEDIELTWRVHWAGHRVAFAPRAKVYAEVPSTLSGLWKQRVRWARGLAQTAAMHRGRMLRPGHGPFAFFAPVNVLSMLAVPVLQLLVLLVVPALVGYGLSPLPSTLVGLAGWLGLVVALAATLLAIGLDRAWRDLRFLYVLPLWAFYSLFMTAVTVWALVLEAAGRQALWNKLPRTGVVSRT